MSKSKGNVGPADYIAQFGLDAFRYFVYREMVFGQDASFTDKRCSVATMQTLPMTLATWRVA